MTCRRGHKKQLLLLFAGLLGPLCFAGWRDFTDLGGTVTASSQIHSGESKEMAFDNTSSTKWLTSYTPTGWIQFQFPEENQYTVKRYSITSANDAPERDPRNWTLYGSNDGLNWAVVDSQLNQSWSSRFLRREFECASPNAYSYYRLSITANNGSPNLTGFSEMELIGFLSWIDRTDYGGIVTASSQIHEGESKEMAFDNTSSTKWLTYFTAAGWIQFQFPQGNRYAVQRYSITSANDAPERDPNNWVLYGSNDELTWNVVDTRANQRWNSRFLRREFKCAFPNPYNYYRLDITGNNGSANLTGFSEMELLEETYIAENPFPANHDKNVPVNNLVLSWDDAEGLSNPAYRIYLSPSLSLVQNADSSALQSEQSQISLLMTSLDSFTDYYWRVDVLGNATVYPGTIWQFQTQQPEVNCLHLRPDIDYNCEVGLSDLVIMASQWLSDSFPADYRGDLDDSARVDVGDMAILSGDWSAAPKTVILSEMMADNETTLADNFGRFSDWIEIRNLADTPCHLQGWFLTDNRKVPNKWAFPNVTLEARGMLIVFASERNLTDNPNALHTNFKLSGEGEYLALIKPDGTIAHEVIYPSMGNDESWGMTALPGEETLVAALLDEPTPGLPNAAAVVSVKPVFSMPAGFYTSSLSVELSVSEPDCRIHYTLDGSVPTQTSALYTGPLTVSKSACIRAAAFKDKYLPGKTSTRSYLFPAEAVQQPALPEGFPSMWKSVAADYAMASDITTHPAYGPMVQPSLLSLPTISMVTSLTNLFDSATGIYTNPLQEGVAWERPVSIEIIQPDTSEVFQVDCGLRIQGGAFRSLDLTRKKSFRLLFKRDYGPGKLKYPLFQEARNVADGFDTIVLRAGANDGYSWNSARLTEQYIRDEFGRSLQRDSGNAGAHGTFYHLYLNGLYWGLYNVVERPDHAFGAAYYGGDKDNWDAINSGDVTNGDDAAWNTLLNKCRAGLGTLAAYQEIQGNNPDGSRNTAYPVLIDVPNYIDYMILNFWGGNGDWPWRNYWMGRLRTEESTGFKFYCWDYESTMGSPFAVTDKVSGNNEQGVGELHRWLRENPEYRLLFADRLHRLFFHNGILTPDSLVQRYSALADKVQLAMVAESARWGDMLSERDWILNTYLPPRSAVVLGQMRTNGLYPQIDAPIFHLDGDPQHGGYFNAGQSLSMTCAQSPSAIWYTTDGSDPRLPGGAVNSTAVQYTGPLTLHETWPVKARTLADGQWSALNEAVFALRATTDDLRITELMYHPADPNTEYIELKNIGTGPISLNGVAFTAGIAYTFGSVTLAPGGYVLVVENLPAFQALYGTGLNVAGQYIGALDNAGEKIRLVDALGADIHHFEYKDSWYDITDGQGFSLTVKDPAAANPDLWNEKAGWRPGNLAGGSPGSDDTGDIPAVGSIVINEILAHSDLEAGDWIELYNTTDTDIHIGGWFLSDNNNDDPNRMKYQIADGTIIRARQYAVFYENQHFANPLDPGCSRPFRLSENGETLYLQSGRNGALTGYYEEEAFGASERDIAFGRHQNSTGKYNFVAMSANTPGAANAYPKVGPVLMSEIMYNPPAGGSYDHDEYEYIELLNISAAPVALYEWDPAQQVFVPWKFTEGIDYTFPLGVSIPSGGRILVVKNPAAFKQRYPAVNTSIIYGPYPDTQLSNGGEKLELAKPGDLADGIRYYIRMDRVVYSDGSHPADFDSGTDPWPTAADGSGNSLHQKTPTTPGQNYANDVANWKADAPTPGNG